MNKISIGILGTSEIAFRRFLPALQKSKYFTYKGIASRDIKKTKKFIDEFGGKTYDGYKMMIEDESIDSIYIPLPPALHFKWAKKALKAGKHVLLEKPSTTKLVDTKKLVKLAKKNDLTLYENYMFLTHRQLRYIQDMIKSGKIGDIRLIRTAFTFPKKAEDDFRYRKNLGGGALLDCGGYPIKLARILLGNSMRLTSSKLNYMKNIEVDMYGSASFENDDGLVAQISFGMDNSYKCELEILGSKGVILAPRIFTMPPNEKVKVFLNQKEIMLEEDDQFLNSIDKFYGSVVDESKRDVEYEAMLEQMKFLERIKGYKSFYSLI